MKMKQITNISLKNNSAFRELSYFYGIPKDSLSLMIIRSLLSHGYIADNASYCGRSLEMILRQEEITVETFAKRCFHCSYTHLIDLLKDIVIWGTESSCPDCGCKTIVEDKKLKCTNCNFKINLIPKNEIIEYINIYLN